MALTDAASSSAVTQAEIRRGLSEKTVRRLTLTALCFASVAAGLVFGRNETGAQAGDPNLALLLNAMLVMKAGLALAGFGAVWWRLGLFASHKLAAGYISGAALLALGSALLFKGGGFLTAGTIFHAGVLALLVLAWRDGFDQKSVKRSPSSAS